MITTYKYGGRERLGASSLAGVVLNKPRRGEGWLFPWACTACLQRYPLAPHCGQTAQLVRVAGLAAEPRLGMILGPLVPVIDKIRHHLLLGYRR